jgi:DNA-binding MarR family transcriptional regulator
MAEHLAAHLFENFGPAGNRSSCEQLHGVPFNFLYIRFLKLSQSDLRQKLSYSEAGVSPMIADLEDRGLIRKIKKGGGNIILLTELEK